VASAGGGSNGSSSARAANVLVVGLGTAVPALVAARGGATVVWAERSPRLADIARRLARRNGLPRVRIVVYERWSELTGAALLEEGGSAARFDAVLTEEIDEEDVAEGAPRLRRLSAHAHQHLLRAGGRMIPGSVTQHGELCSVRTTTVCGGLDLRGMNVFRGAAASAAYDVEHLLATDAFGRQQPKVLSAPFRLLSVRLQHEQQHQHHRQHTGQHQHEQQQQHHRQHTGQHQQQQLAEDAAKDAAARSHSTELRPASRTRTARASCAGILKCVSTWVVVDLGGGVSYDARPNWGRPAPLEQRALRQPLRFLGCEWRVACEEDVRLRLLPGGGIEPAVLPHEMRHLLAATRYMPWPVANAFAYHFPMVADEGRNGAFEDALRLAIAEHVDREGRPPHVLDIGAGSGLLAMLAVRHGAARVTTVEMVPALAAVARHAIRANGYAEHVTLVEGKSTDLSLHDLGGAPADILVCEIVDDALLGEGVISTMSDAKARLLRDGAVSIHTARTQCPHAPLHSCTRLTVARVHCVAHTGEHPTRRDGPRYRRRSVAALSRGVAAGRPASTRV
jgi:predicted RNA methylase